MARHLEDYELENITGGKFIELPKINGTPAITKKCCVCKKHVNNAIIYNHKYYCPSCYADLVKDIGAPQMTI